MYWSGSLSSVCPVSAPTLRIKQDKLKFSNVTSLRVNRFKVTSFVGHTRLHFKSKSKKNINLRMAQNFQRNLSAGNPNIRSQKVKGEDLQANECCDGTYAISAIMVAVNH